MIFLLIVVVVIVFLLWSSQSAKQHSAVVERLSNLNNPPEAQHQHLLNAKKTEEQEAWSKMYEETKRLDPLAAARKRLDFARHQKLSVSMRLAGLGEAYEGEEAE